jgi:DNA adenine methylase
MPLLQGTLKAPFPYAGGKSWIAHEVWQRFGAIANYVEPFCGSAAVLLARPKPSGVETINDTDGFIVNAYRSICFAPEETAVWCDWPVTESDLHSKHAWLLTQRESLTARLEGDPLYYDPRSAGWWIWGACCWIGNGWCSGDGPWYVENSMLRRHGDTGRGIHRQLPHLGNAGQGIHRQLPHLGDAGQGIQNYLLTLANRLRSVRITCGEWQRVVGPSVTWRHGMTGIFLDPPYPENKHDFGYVTGNECWEDCWNWAQEQGDHPLLRIVICGYDDGRRVPEDWQIVRWKARGGYGSQGNGRARENATHEILYCSPACRRPDNELPLFAITRSSGIDVLPRLKSGDS